MSNMEPKRGAIARCGRNQLGIILSKSPQRIQYATGEWADVWTGIHLETNNSYPGLWSSRKPTVLGYIPEYLLKQTIEIRKPVDLRVVKE